MSVSPFDIDLEPIVVKAMDKSERMGWSLEFALSVESEYRRYLALCLAYPDLPLVPSALVDDFWHLHILDTLKYAVDCDDIFGEFLHHFPYFGMRGAEDEANLAKAWYNTLKLYKIQFQEAAPEDIWAKSQRCPNCGRRCKNDVRSQYAMEQRPRLMSVMV